MSEDKLEIKPGIDFTQILFDADGSDLINSDDEPQTIGEISSQALLAMFQDDKDSAEEKKKRYVLWLKVNKAIQTETPLVLTSKQKTLVLDRIGKGWNPLVYGQCYEAIEGVSLADEEDED